MKSAINFSNAGISEEWIDLFFNITCDNISISENLLEESWTIFGLAKLPLRSIETKNISETYGYMKLPLYEGDKLNKPLLVIQSKQGNFSVIV